MFIQTSWYQITLTLFIVIYIIQSIVGDEKWHQDLTNDMKIGLTKSGYESVHLLCGADSMKIDIVLSEESSEGDEFEGVIYTRGSFHRKQPPCFLEPKKGDGRSFTMKFSLDQCQTLHEGSVYSNVIIVQHDKDLIMPGDIAFNLECDFSKPRDITVNADLLSQKTSVSSRITLTDADPAAVHQPREKRSTAESDTESVVFTPANVIQETRKENDEL